jgi:hypothetical protein
VALAIGADGGAVGLSAVAGYMLLSVWMIASGIGLILK